MKEYEILFAGNLDEFSFLLTFDQNGTVFK